MAKILSNNDKATIKSAIKSVVVTGKSFGRSSITKMAQNSIFEYPHIISAAIETNEAMTLLKSSEFALSNFVVMSIARRNSVDIDKYGNIENYLANIHNNSDINPNFLGMGVITDSDISNATEGFTITNVEDASGMFSIEDKQKMAIECLNNWDVTGALDTESLNDIYKPYNRTKYQMQEDLQLMRETAMEATTPKSILKNAARRNANSMNVGKVYREAKQVEEEQIVRDKSGKPVYAVDAKGKKIEIGKDKNGNPIYQYKKEKVKKIVGGQMQKFGKFRDGVNGPSFVDATKRQLSTMEPTLLNVTLSCYGKDLGNWSQNVVLGVKALPRIIRSDIMINNMVSAAVGSNGAFAFIKLAEKELKTALFMFGPFKAMKESKDAALAGYDTNKFMDMIKKRKMFNSLQSLNGAPVPPNMTIIMTTAEAEKVRELTGVDLLNPSQARSLIDKYYILAFGIYDTETKEYRVMYDTDRDWNYNTLYSLQANGTGKTYMDTYKKVMEPMRI